MLDLQDYVVFGDKFTEQDNNDFNKLILSEHILDPSNKDSTFCTRCFQKTPMLLYRCEYCDKVIHYVFIECYYCNNIGNCHYEKFVYGSVCHNCIIDISYQDIQISIIDDYLISVVKKTDVNIHKYLKTTNSERYLYLIKYFLGKYKQSNDNEHYHLWKKNIRGLKWTKHMYPIYYIFCNDIANIVCSYVNFYT